MRPNNRKNNELRPLIFTPHYIKNADGSVLVELGETKIIVTAMIDERVPPFLKDTGKGWLTAEYSLLPGSTSPRAQREVNKGKPTGRTSEIQRLIGRSLRAAFNLDLIGQRTIAVDADVINADASTRVASICGGFIACYFALKKLKENGSLKDIPLINPVAAVSVGIVNDEPMLDLSYVEDSKAEVDGNVVMNKNSEIIELQMTAEGKPFKKESVDKLLSLAHKGIHEIIQKQLEIIG